MNIVSVSVAHDSGACLLVDGELKYFYKEERLSRKKRDNFPILSLQKILDNVEGKIDAFVFCPVVYGESVAFETFTSIVQKNGFNLNDIKIFNLEDRHHLQHASMAFYNSGFEEANVIVVDRNGSDWFVKARESETIFKAEYPNSFEPLYKNFWMYEISFQEDIFKWSIENNVECDARSLFGIVKVYESATTMIGQDGLENGKTMGLAAYGDRNRHFPNFFVEGTNIPNDFYFFHLTTKNSNYQSIYYPFLNISSDNFSEDNYKDYADLAWQVQHQTQNALKYLVEKSLKKNKTKNVVITGGYGLNVVANQFLIKEFPEINFFFDPMADDSGTCIGGAIFAYRELSKDKKINKINNLFFHGENYSLDGVSGKEIGTQEVAEIIFDNKPIALYNGKAEAGPRALGNRSILFNPLNKDAKRLINIVKKREWYRPFALSVLEEDAEKYFDMLGIVDSRFMTISFDALEKTKLLFPGVVHVDGSCRIQTVPEGHGPLYKLLKEFKSISGHGVLLNTSFNLAGEPLVETVDDAFHTMYNSDLYGIWFPEVSKLVTKEKGE